MSTARGQALGRRHRARALEVEHNALLAGVELAELAAGAITQRRPRAHHVALGRLDFDDLGAEVGEQPRAVRAGDRRREIEDPQARQCFFHLAFPPVADGGRFDGLGVLRKGALRAKRWQDQSAAVESRSSGATTPVPTASAIDHGDAPAG